MNDTYTTEMAHAAVQRGAEWLDQKCPDWAERIDLTALDLAEPACCVLGQTADCLVGTEKMRGGRAAEFRLEGGYWRVLDSLGYGPFSAWQREHGFDAPLGRGIEASEAYAMLTIAWTELIRERLAVAA